MAVSLSMLSKTFEFFNTLAGFPPSGNNELTIFAPAINLAEDDLGEFWYEALAKQSPKVLGGEIRGDGNGPCQGTPPETLRFTIVDKIVCVNLMSAEQGSIPEASALSARSKSSTVNPTSFAR